MPSTELAGWRVESIWLSPGWGDDEVLVVGVGPLRRVAEIGGGILGFSGQLRGRCHMRSGCAGVLPRAGERPSCGVPNMRHVVRTRDRPYCHPLAVLRGDATPCLRIGSEPAEEGLKVRCHALGVTRIGVVDVRADGLGSVGAPLASPENEVHARPAHGHAYAADATTVGEVVSRRRQLGGAGGRRSRT